MSVVFSFATKLFPLLPWLTRTSPSLPMSARKPRGDSGGLRGWSWGFLNACRACGSSPIDRHLLWVAPATCLTDQRALQHAAELSLFSFSILHDLALYSEGLPLCLACKWTTL
jgi:hypothetical protein